MHEPVAIDGGSCLMRPSFEVGTHLNTGGATFVWQHGSVVLYVGLHFAF